jgi:hypothetical protein
MLLHVLAAGFPFGGCTRNTVLPHGLQAGNRRRRCCGRLGFTKVAGLVGRIVVIEAGSSLARPIGRAIVVAERGLNIVGLSIEWKQV